MQETNFDRLLHRYLHRQMTPEEHIKFTAWLDLLEKENAQDLELSAEAKEQLFQKITSKITTTEDIVALYPRSTLFKRAFSKRWIQVAATVSLLLVAVVIVKLATQKSTEFPKNKKLTLNDGTIVWLADAGDVNYYEKDGARFARFEGNGLFEVAKIPSRPFTITCGNINIRVLGTSFTLKTASDQIELKVLTGKVHVTSTTDSIGADINPNETIIYSNNGSIERSLMSMEDIANISSNEEYNLNFHGETMDKVMARLSKKFDVEIQIENPQLNKCHVTADFTDISLDETLRILTDILDVSYGITGKRINISGKGC